MSKATQVTSDEATEPVVRELEHQSLPVPAAWTIDPMHSLLAFECQHMMLVPLHGSFSSYSGEIAIAEVPEESSVEVTIDADSLQVPHPMAATHLKGENYLEVERYGTLRFRSTSVRHVEARRWKIVGDLTIKDVTREVVLDTSFAGVVIPPPQFGGLRARMAFRATTAFDRRDFGLDHNTPLPGGGWLVGNRVGITLDVEATLA